MKRIILFLILGICISCTEKKAPVKKELTDNEKVLYSQMSLEYKVYMDNCLNGQYGGDRDYYDFTRCLILVKEEFKNCYIEPNKNESSGTSIIKTAVGTAVGIGAAKMIFGSRKK